MVTAIQSFTSSEQYNLNIHEHSGEATSCSCKSFQFGKGRACKHMVAFETQLNRAATFILLQNKVREMQETSRCYREMAIDSRFN